MGGSSSSEAGTRIQDNANADGADAGWIVVDTIRYGDKTSLKSACVRACGWLGWT